MKDLARYVHLYNDSEPFAAMWDGKEYELGAEPLRIQAGVAEHWIGVHKHAALRMEEIEAETVEPRSPINPLEATDRGEAFSAIKRRGPRKASGE